MTQTSDFVHLHMHSHYSLLDGACMVDKLVASAAAYGMPALAITDHGNLFGAIEFYKACLAQRIRPIIGCEVYIAGEGIEHRTRENPIYHMTLLAKDRVGYANLIKLVSMAYMEGFYQRPRMDDRMLAENSTGLMALSGCLNGRVPQQLLKGKFDQAVASAKRYREIFDGDFYIEVMDHSIAEEKIVLPQLVKLSKEIGIGLVATNDAHYIQQEDSKAQEVLLCISTGKTMKDESRMTFGTDECFVRSPAQMRQLFAKIPEAIDNAGKIADKLRLDLDFNTIHLPKFEVPEGATEDTYLERLCREALPVRYPAASREVLDRLVYELGVIKKMGFSSYFLIVWDFIRFAKSTRIPVGPGRGSAAGSMVAYLLGITDLDPIRFGLFFERFLNPGRQSMPDIDIDFCERRRSEVIDYVRAKYGAQNVCQIITFGVLKAKAALKDVSRVLDIPFAEANQITKAVPEVLNIKLEEALATSPELRKWADRYPELFRYATALEGVARHSSTHAAGVVITPDTLWKYVPLYARDGEVVTQYTMKWLEAIGVLKMDFLGLSTLTVVQLARDHIAANRGVHLAIERIPLNDKRTFRLLASGETTGVFTFETSAFKDLLSRLRPTCFEDLVASQALGRPGPLQSGMVDEYIAAKHGEKAVHYPDPRLKDILKETYGVFIYQEQVMQCANALAGYTLAEADGLRKAMGKKIQAEMEKHRERFVKGSVERGLDSKHATEIFDLMEKFAAYGFNKAHSACYALVSYQTAFLKANFPAEFMAALLTIEMANTEKVAWLIEECEHVKIEVLPPDVNESGTEFSVIGRRIRFGLAAIKNLGSNVARAIMEARARHGRFTNFEDFCKSVDLHAVNRRAIESLIKCGAFGTLGASRAQLLAVVDQAMDLGAATQRHQDAGQATLLDLFAREGSSQPESILSYPEIPEFGERELLAFEKETLGLYVSGHPLLAHEALLSKIVTSSAAQLDALEAERTFILAGLVKSVRRVSVKATGKVLVILNLEDLSGSLEIPLFSEVIEGRDDELAEDTVVILSGKIAQRRDGERRPQVENFVPLDQLLGPRGWPAIVTLRAPEDVWVASEVPKVKALVQAHKGRHPLHIEVQTEHGTVKIRAGKAWSVTPGREFVSGCEGILGPGSVSVRLRPPDPVRAPRPGSAAASKEKEQVPF